MTGSSFAITQIDLKIVTTKFANKFIFCPVDDFISQQINHESSKLLTDLTPPNPSNVLKAVIRFNLHDYLMMSPHRNAICITGPCAWDIHFTKGQ